MLRSALFASLIAFGAAGAALATGNPVLRGAGDDAMVEYGAALPGAALGGGQISTAGSGQDRSYTYGSVNTFPGHPGQTGRVVGGAADAQVIYQPEAAPAATGQPRVTTGAGAFRG